MGRASRDEHNYICLPEQASSFTQTKLVPEIYTKDEINEMFYGACGAQEKNEGEFQMNLDGVYYPLNDSISWLTTCMEEMRQDIAKIQHAADKHRPTSIDNRLLIDYGFDSFSSMVYSILEIFGVSTRDDHLAGPSVHIGDE
ncbi:hypothetical protein F2Q70_00021859 [Brassica cretica]|uniref:Uncharacterized protein n=2 Tax=Brassica cretica TaxID=69181 RepID=A0A8S9GLQ0_BRACR|nr:hypothetical protein F2Q70_00021859 [Brassica cretica]KAF2559603.1 hypothetical protein F2Q68_00015612 [Brassica cretica]KAF3607104.1 hypothetical protein DY000_02048223 [Brassica cretica]